MVSARTCCALICSALSIWGGAGIAGAAGAGTITVVDDAGGCGCGLTSIRTCSAHAHPIGSASATSPVTAVANNARRFSIPYLLVVLPWTAVAAHGTWNSRSSLVLPCLCPVEHRPCHLRRPHGPRAGSPWILWPCLRSLAVTALARDTFRPGKQ